MMPHSQSRPLKLDIFLQTHSGISVHTGNRYIEATKSELMLRCANSLVVSINQADADIRLTVVDDHSDERSFALLERILAKCRYPTRLIRLEDKGYNASALRSFSEGREQGREVVYFVEDDYLHTPSAIQEMIEAYMLFKNNLGGAEVALHPYDDQFDYRPNRIPLSRVVLGTRRHWRTNTHTTNTCMLSAELMRRNWHHFERLALYSSTPYGDENNIFEGTTINLIWQGQATLFMPIPSLALHVQFAEHINPLLNWKEWWEQAAY